MLVVHPPLLPPILFPSSSSLSLSFLQLHWRENPKSKPKLKCRPTSSILPGPLVPTYNSLSSLMLLSYDLKTDYKSNIHLKKKLFKLYWSGEGKKTTINILIRITSGVKTNSVTLCFLSTNYVPIITLGTGIHVPLFSTKVGPSHAYNTFNLIKSIFSRG